MSPAKWWPRLFLALLCTALLIAPGCTAKKPAAKDTLVVAQGTDVENLDAHGIQSTPAAIVTEHIFETLVTLNEKGEVVPRLATSWSSTPDGLEWTFKLRQGVKFHDGTEFNAEAVKFNIERLLNPEVHVPLRTYINMVKNVEVIGPYEVKIVLKYPHAPFLHRLTASCNAMVSPEAVRKYGKDFGLHPVGTGPFKFVEWVKGDRLVLERNESYWGEKPKIKRIIFKPVPEDATRVTMLESGDVDLIVRVPPHEVPRLQNRQDLNVLFAPSTRTVFIGFNCQKEPFKDVRVRQAFNYAVNKEEIVRDILKGAGRVMDAPVIPEMFGYSQVGSYPYDPDKARALLKEAGIPEGYEVNFMCTEGRYLMDKRIGEAIQGYLDKVGIKARIQTMEWATYLAHLQKPVEENTVQMYMLGWGPWILDADQQLVPMFHSKQWPPNGLQSTFYRNEQVDALLDKATSTTDPGQRQEAYAQAQRLIMQDAPWLFLHQEQQIIAMKKSLHGVVILPIEQLRLQGAYFEETK
jgi:peptide/nickel transport system substrate-binding protein